MSWTEKDAEDRARRQRGAVIPRSEAEKVAYEMACEKLVEAITLHHERCKTLGLNDHRGTPQWGGPWDHELWATIGLPSGPSEERHSACPGTGGGPCCFAPDSCGRVGL